MGCGSSGQVVAPEAANGNLKANGRSNGHGNDHDNDDLPTVVLPDTPAKKPPIAFEIPLEEFDGNKRAFTSPPPHLQRLLQPPQAEISLPNIEEKLAEAEQRRQTILQQRAASAQKRTQKMMKSFSEMDQMDSEQDLMDMDGTNQDHTGKSMKMETSRIEDPFSNKMDPMNTDPRMSNSSKRDYATSNKSQDDLSRKGLDLEHVPTSMGMGQKVDLKKQDPIKNDSVKRDSINSSKYGRNAVRIPPEPGVCEDKNI